MVPLKRITARVLRSGQRTGFQKFKDHIACIARPSGVQRGVAIVVSAVGTGGIYLATRASTLSTTFEPLPAVSSQRPFLSRKTIVGVPPLHVVTPSISVFWACGKEA